MVTLSFDAMPGLLEAFFARFEGPSRPAALEAKLAGALSRARSAWPEVGLDEDRFAAALAERLSANEDPVTGLDAMLVQDVYLVTAATEGDARALAIMDHEHFPAARAALAQMGFLGASADEALQDLRRRLFVERPAKASAYAGRGSFRGWLRAVAVRDALRERRRFARNVSWNESAAAVAVDNDPDLELMKRKYAEPFQRAFREALAELTVDERLLLKQRYAHHVGVEALAAMHGVHASTISRRVTDSRERLVAGTREALMRLAGLGRAEASSIIRLVQSQLEVTLSSVVAERPGDDRG